MKKCLVLLLTITLLLAACSNPTNTQGVFRDPSRIVFDSIEEIYEFMEISKAHESVLREYLLKQSHTIDLYTDDGRAQARVMTTREHVQIFLDAVDHDLLWFDFDGLTLDTFEYRWDFMNVTDAVFRMDGLYVRIRECQEYDDYAKEWRKTWFRKEKLTKTFQVGEYTLEMGPLKHETHDYSGEEDPRTEWNGYLMTETHAFNVWIVARKPEYQNTDFLTAENFSIKTFAEIAALGAPEA